MAVQDPSAVSTIYNNNSSSVTTNTPPTATSAGIRDRSNVFSFDFGRRHYPNQHVVWPSFSVSTRSFWTKYCLLCTVCGSAATILAGIFLVVAALFRYYTTSINYFETVPTYIPAILLSICGVSTIAFSCKRNRNIILLRITACWSLVSAALSSVITISTSLIHMNRLQTLKECVYIKHPPRCSCYSHFGFDMASNEAGAPDYVFEDTPDCDVIHGTLYSCLRAVFAISVVSVLLSIFLCMLLYQLIGHERKKAYWSRIRRINSDWSADFIACLARPMPRERSSMMPLMMSPSSSHPAPLGPPPSQNSTGPPMWSSQLGPPPPYEEIVREDEPLQQIPMQIPMPIPLTAPQTITIPASATTIITVPSAIRTANPGQPGSDGFYNGDGFLSPHPFSPTITSVDPIALFRQHQENVLNHTQQQQLMYNNQNRNVCRVHGRPTYSPMRPVIRIFEQNKQISPNPNMSMPNSHVNFVDRESHEASTVVTTSNNIEVDFRSENQQCSNNVTKDFSCDSDDSNSVSMRFDPKPQNSLNYKDNLNAQVVEQIESEDKILNVTTNISDVCNNNKCGSFTSRNSSLPCSPMLSGKVYIRQKSAENVHQMEKPGNITPLVFRNDRKNQESSGSDANIEENFNLTV